MDTICAIATPTGRGGIGIVRVSGPKAVVVSEALIGLCPAPRRAIYSTFNDMDGEPIDNGIVLFFRGPNSFTGEDVVEFQGHGGPVVLDTLLTRITSMGVRLARPGEFTERAFINDRIDLVQAEAVADLIDSSSRQAARAAMRSLGGEFSALIAELDQQVLQLRVFVEGAIDFPEEEIDFLADPEARTRGQAIASGIVEVLSRASRGAAMQSGVDVVIGGAPNVGKSSLLNALAGDDRAIVTDIPGTTRDVVDVRIVLDGLPVRVVDTAGIRLSADPVEQEGINRARRALEEADAVIWVTDDRAKDADEDQQRDSTVLGEVGEDVPLIAVRNKCDLSENPAAALRGNVLRLSALTGEGVDLLREAIKDVAGFSTAEDAFLGRRRHLDALEAALAAQHQVLARIDAGEGELAAETLREVQQHLGSIVGVTTTDDLLGAIFSTFCIGK